MENERLRNLLLRSGYHIREREDGWSECLIFGHGECWHGRGLGEDEAFERALARLFPSKLALDLLRAALEVRPERPAEVGEGGSPAGEAPRQEAPPDAPRSDPAATTPAPERPRPSPDAVPEGIRPASEAAPEEGRTAPEAEPDPEDAAVSSASASNADDEDEAAALAELTCLEARIEAALPELAEAAPHRQRLVLLGWVAQARHHQDVLPSSGPVYARVSRIVRALRCKSDGWWPGMIAAFQRRAHPAVAARDLKELSPSTLLSWERVAEATQQALAQVEKEDEALGRDELGWADEEALSPAPREPCALFDDLRAEIESQGGGDLFGWQPKEQAPPTEAELLRWARLLRWLRNRVEGAAWGAAMGRLRFWAGATSSARLRALLDAGHRPASPWASLVMAESERMRFLELERILATTPAVRADEHEIVSWLERALPHTSKYKRAVEDAARPLAERIFLIHECQLSEADRRIRRRLQKLKEALAGGEEPHDAARDDAADLPRADAKHEVPEVLRRETEGLRVLYVSNRSEERLREKLQARFGFRGLAWEEAAPRRVAAAIEAIATGSYDLVMGATGFLGHSCDLRLRKACKTVGVPYVRVKKGKSGEVQYSLERDLLGIPGRERARVTA